MSKVKQILSFQKPSDLALRTVFTPRPKAQPKPQPQKAKRTYYRPKNTLIPQSIAGLCITGISINNGSTSQKPKKKRSYYRPKRTLANNDLGNSQYIAGLCMTGISIEHGPNSRELKTKNPTKSSNESTKARTKRRKLPKAKGSSRVQEFRLRDGSKRKPPEVVNEKLMDDVLNYLAPTLEKYKGCTVLDMQPGSCMWSRKVHNFLRPKCHVLIEPEDQYQQHIDELVSGPDSTYKHVALAPSSSQTVSDTWNSIFDEQGPVPRSRLASDDPKLVQTDYSLLVIGSLNRRDDLSYYGRAKSGSLWAVDALSLAALENKFMHRQGPVRMLLWVPEQDRGIFLPEHTIHNTEKQAAISLAMDVQAVVEIEKVLSRKIEVTEWSTAGRWTGLHLASEDKVSHRMSRYGMQVPSGRKIRRLVGDDCTTQKHASKSPFEVNYETVEDVDIALAELEQRWNNEKLQFEDFGMNSSGHGQYKPDEVYPLLTYTELADAISENPTKSHRSMLKIRARKEQGIEPGSLSFNEARLAALPSERPGVAYLTGADVRTALYADATLRGINLEMHCKILEEQGHDTTELERRIIHLQNSIAAKSLPTIDEYERFVEDWVSFFSPTPLLTVDRRQYEPLKASPEDFDPQHNLNLLDFTPTNRDMTVPGLADRGKAAAACRDLMNFLFMFKGQSVTSVLDRIAPNASTDLICQVPAMTDPRKGGRLDPRHLKVRHLTAEMLEGLTKAWFEWPFRPEGWEFLANSRGGDYSVSGAGVSGPVTPEAVTAVDDGEGVD